MKKIKETLPSRTDGSVGSLSHGDSTNGGAMPDPKPIFEKFLAWALELGIVTYVMLIRTITALEILETLESEPGVRARIYSACTGMAEKFAIRFGFDRQAEDIDMAIDTDDEVAEKFALAVGISHYVKHFAIEKIYSFVMNTVWMFDSTSPANREFAARLCSALVEHKAWNDSSTRTHERILRAISIEALFGDMVPADLRVRMVESLQRYAKLTRLKHLGEVLFNPEDGVSFKELSEHLEVRMMAEPFVHYATELGLAKAEVPESEFPPASEEASETFADEEGILTFAVEDDEEDFTGEVSADVAEALTQLGDKAAEPPPLPSKPASSDG